MLNFGASKRRVKGVPLDLHLGGHTTKSQYQGDPQVNRSPVMATRCHKQEGSILPVLRWGQGEEEEGAPVQ